MHAFLTALSLIACPQIRGDKILSICLDDVSKEFLSHARALGAVPNLEALAAMGRSYEHFYTAPVCSTSRARFLLGRYHTGVGNNFKPKDPIQWSMDPRGSFPSELPGKSTHVGKWHLAGEGDLSHPLECGFQAWMGSFRNVDDYYHWGTSSPEGTRRNLRYATEWVTRVAHEALSSFDFVSLNLNTAHEPLHAPPPHLHTFGDLTDASKKELATGAGS